MIISVDVPDSVVEAIQDGLRRNRVGFTRADGDIKKFIEGAIMGVYFERLLESEYANVMSQEFPEWQTL